MTATLTRCGTYGCTKATDPGHVYCSLVHRRYDEQQLVETRIDLRRFDLGTERAQVRITEIEARLAQLTTNEGF